MKKSIKIPITIISIIFGLFLILAIVYGIFYMQVEEIRFDVADNSGGNETCEIKMPFFGNTLLTNGSPAYGVWLFGGGEKTIPVYSEINNRTFSWMFYVTDRYTDAKVDYTVEQDDKFIVVNYSGSGLDKYGNRVEIKDKFVFDIEGASPEHLPIWIAEESSDDYNDFIAYCRDPEKNVRPEWLLDE